MASTEEPDPLATAALEQRLAVHLERSAPALADVPSVGHGQSATYWVDTHDRLDRARDVVVRALPDEVASSMGVALLDGLARMDGWMTATTLLPALSGRRLPYDLVDVALLFDLAIANESRWQLLVALKLVCPAASRLPTPDLQRLEPRIRFALEHLEASVDQPSERARLRNALLALLRRTGSSSVAGALDVAPIRMGDGWGRFAIARLESAPNPAWASELLVQAATATSGPRPPKVWWRRAAELARGAPEATDVLHDLLDGVTGCEPLVASSYGVARQTRVGPGNGDLVRGLIFVAAAIEPPPPWLVPTLARIAADRLDGDGKVINACFAVLGRIGSPECIGALTQLQRGSRDRDTLKQIARALDEAATKVGLSRSELLETTVQDGGLGADRARRWQIGDVDVTLELEGGGAFLRWERAGHRLRGAPKDLQDADGPTVASIKREAAELRTLLATERARLEQLIAEDRCWPVDAWMARYIDHPVTGFLASRMLWQVEEPDDDAWVGLPAGGAALRMADGSTRSLSPEAQIRPWHPLSADPDLVRRWRDRLMADEIVQPFKQAFREVYLLTPAEEETGTYSNRFAAHVLDYQQVYALMKERRWATNYLGPWEAGWNGEAKRDFPDAGLQAVFFHEPIDEDMDGGRVAYCITDQVRFVRLGDRTRDPVQLVGVPPLVLSEAMRDVDLFVGVASIAADPTWMDRGADRHQEYWVRTAFGELTANAGVRRDAIERLLPMLKIRDRAHVEGRYLVVEGTRHTYKIHLGSANVLMSPNDRYLCIVPGRGPTTLKGLRFVPFEGDRTLSVILSKALLLARDDEITDASILRQLT